MKEPRPKLSRLLVFWIVSYLFTLLMPIALGVFVHQEALETITEEVESTSQLTLRQYQSVMDSNLEELEHMSAALGLSVSLKNLASLKAPLGSDAVWNVYQLQKDISSFLLTNSNISEIYLYVNQHDFIVSSGYKYNADALAAACPLLLGLTREEIAALASQKGGQQVRFTGRDTFLYLSPLFVNSFSRPSALMIVKCNSGQFRQLIHNLEQTVQGSVRLVSALGETYGGDAQSALPVDYATLQEKSAIFTLGEGDARMVCTHIPSARFGLQYVSLIPEGVFLSKVRYVRYIIYLSVGLCVVIGTALALYFVHRSYKPVRKLSQMLGKPTGGSIGGVNELAFMEESLRMLLDEKKSIESRLVRQESAIRGNLVSRILKGSIGSAEQARRSLAEHGITLEGDACLVTAISLDRLNGKTLKELGATAAESLAYLLTHGVSERLIRQKYSVAAAEVDGLIAYLVTTQMEPSAQRQDAFYDDCASLMQMAVRFLHDKFDVSLSAFVSDVHIGLDGAAEAFSEVLQAVEYRTLTGEQCPLVAYRSLNSFGQGALTSPLGTRRQHQLGNAIDARDFDAARRVMDAMLEEYAQATPSIQLLRYRAMNILHTMLESIGRVSDPEEIELLNAQPYLQALLCAATLPEMKRQLGDFLDRLAEAQARREQQKTPDWIEAVDAYVRAHYQEPDLSVSGIAEALKLSMSYLSRSYKRYRGAGLLDSIHQYRIQKAKALVNTANLQDVARQVGYYDSKALIRVFKKYEGVTPGKFKDSGSV